MGLSQPRETEKATESDGGNLARPNVFAIKCGRVEMYISVLWTRDP
jgi:hypothetical protein